MGTNPWPYILIFIGVVVLASLLIGLIFCFVIAGAGRRFSDKTLGDYTGQVEKLLPGTNCKKCSFESCQLCAQALIRAEKDDDICPFVTEDQVTKIKEIRKNLQEIMEDPTPKERIDEDADIYEKRF